MRGVRVAAGLVLVGAGWLALAIGVAGWVVGAHRDSDGAFRAGLAPVHTNGDAIVVPDVAELVARHGLGSLLGDGRLTLAVRSDQPVDVAVLPARDLPRVLGTAPYTEVVGVGLALGAQPVQTVERPGPVDSPTPIVAASTLVQSAATVTLNLPTDEPTAVVIRRLDDQPGLTVAFTAGLVPNAWGAVIAFSLSAGALCLAVGALLLLLRHATDPVIVDLNTPDEELGPQWTPRRHAVAVARRARWRKDRKPSSALRWGTRESPYVHTAT